MRIDHLVPMKIKIGVIFTMKKLISLSMAALCLLSCAVSCGDSSSSKSKKSDSPFVGKWEASSLKMGDMTLESLMGIPMYAVANAEIKDDGTIVVASPLAGEDLGMEGFSVSDGDEPQEGTWKEVDEDTIEVTVEVSNEDKDEDKETLSFDLVDGKLVMSEEEEGMSTSVTFVKVDDFTKIDVDEIKKNMEESGGLFGGLGADDTDDDNE